MKIVFISDIHGNSGHLHIIDQIDFDKLICLGDIGSNIIVSNWLIKHKEKLICLKGNCDYNDFPLFQKDDTISFYLDNICITCNHGNIYSYTKGNLNFKHVLIYGHEHIPYIKQKSNKTYICVGSIGSPRNNSKPSFCIYENNTFTLYDIQKNIIDSIKIDA